MQNQNIRPNMGLMSLERGLNKIRHIKVFCTKSIFDSSLKLLKAAHPIWLLSKHEIQYVAILMTEVSSANFTET